VNRVTEALRNQRTQNSDGILLNHSTKVNELKISYKMTPEEKIRFDQWDKEHKERVKEFKDNAVQNQKDYEKEYAAWSKSIQSGQLSEEPKPLQPPKKPSSHEPVFLGLELEVVARGTERTSAGLVTIIASIADSPFGDHCIVKADGSIGTYGMEIVTIPATLAYHKKFMDDNFFKPPYSFHKRVTATDQCGIHVHISKNALTPLDLGKLITFVNSLTTRAFIDLMAGRTQNNYCQKQAAGTLSIKGIPIFKGLVSRACQKGRIKEGLSKRRIESASHYDAINIQNANTIEIRIFKSSNDKNNIMRKLEFCDSLVKFVRCHAPLQMTTYDYVEFLLRKENKKEYPNVVRWLASKNFIEHTRKKAKDPKTGEVINKLLHVYSTNKIPFPNTVFHKNKENYFEYYTTLQKKDTTQKKGTK
jgi:hypothetical protein